MKPVTFLAGLILPALLVSPQLRAQTEYYNVITTDLGWPQQPEDTDPISPLEDYGTQDEMSLVGYQVGDTVADFTVYDFNGNALTLSEELTGDKPVVLMASSVSCIRFRNLFDTSIDSQETTAAREYLIDHMNDFNWIFIYNLEAHPSDGNCPSNCPPVPTLDTAVTQGPDYLYRRYSMHNWETHGWPYQFPFTMYADNPDNGVYNSYFRRAFGLVVINCEGVVIARGDWANQFLTLEQAYLEDLRSQEYQQCEVESTVSIIEAETERYSAYPNPAKDRFRISGMEGSGRIRILEASGRLVSDLGNQQLSEEVQTGHLPAGCYLVQVTPMSGAPVHLPLIIE